MKDPYIVTRRGQEMAVLVPMQEWKRLCQMSRPSLKALLLTDFARAELTAPPRGRHRRRSIPVALSTECNSTRHQHRLGTRRRDRIRRSSPGFRTSRTPICIFPQ